MKAEYEKLDTETLLIRAEELRKPFEGFPYCKLHIIYAFQPKGQKEDVLDKDDEVPEFIEKKVKSSA